MTMLQTDFTLLESHERRGDPILVVDCKAASRRKAPERTDSNRSKSSCNAPVARAWPCAETQAAVVAKPTHVPKPIIQTRIPRAFQQLYIAANRGEHVKDIAPCPPVRQIPRRTRSCLSSKLSRTSLDRDATRKTTRSVSFGAVKGVTVENIAEENKNALWFTRDEYNSMRHEAKEIASATHKRGGPLKETSRRCSRGLEKYIDHDSSTVQVARLSVLEHHDLAMYALASSRAVNEARQLAEKDALEAFSIQQERTITRRVN